MRSILYVLTALSVIGLAFWAYRENYRTQEAQANAQALQNAIGEARARLRVLNAEWAYLNRPDRLMDLVELSIWPRGSGLVPQARRIADHQPC